MSMMGVLSCISWLWVLSPVLATDRQLQSPLFSSDSGDQTPSRNYSIGFSLASTYGSAAVIVDEADQEKKTYTWFVYGDSKYQETMARLSLDEARHIAPPYDDMEEYFLDVPRQLARKALKKAGLPASADVGALASVVKELRTKIESELRITVQDAVFGATHLAALYIDDIEDICEYAGFKYIIPKGFFDPVLHETGSAIAGHGLGLCQHWRNDTQCKLEQHEFPWTYTLGIHYSKTALTSTHASMIVAIGTYESAMGRVENFTLGSNAKARYQTVGEYWLDVKNAILLRMRETPALEKPDRIVLTGEVDDAGFMKTVNEALEEYLGSVPPIYSADPMVVAAKGNAEFRRRGQAPWQ